MNLKTIGKKILEQTLGRGITDAEVYLLDSRSTTIEVKQQKIDAFVKAGSMGAGLRLFRGNQMGFSYTSLSEGSDIHEVIEHAVSSVTYTQEDSNNILPCLEPVSAGDLRILDPGLNKVTEEERISRAMDLEKAALDTDHRIKVTRKAGYRDSEFTSYILNSRGAELDYQGTSCSASIMLMASDGKDQQMGWDSDFSRVFSGLDAAAVGRRAAANALRLLGARTVPTVRCPVLLTPHAAVSFLEVFISAFSADAVQKGKSLLKNRIGKKVASDAFTLADDGRLPGGLGTAPFDDEGIPTRHKLLIREGVLEGFLHNTYTSVKEGCSSTGNGVRSGYASIPHVGPTNLFVTGGTQSREDLLKSMGKGLEIMEILGMHTANPISGDFSVGVAGVWFENGEPSHPVRGAAIAGNVLDLLMKIKGVGNDLRFYGAVGSPSLLIDNLSLSGS